MARSREEQEVVAAVVVLRIPADFPLLLLFLLPFGEHVDAGVNQPRAVLLLNSIPSRSSLSRRRSRRNPREIRARQKGAKKWRSRQFVSSSPTTPSALRADWKTAPLAPLLAVEKLAERGGRNASQH